MQAVASPVAVVPRCLCGGERWQSLFHYEAPPEGETHFSFSGHAYRRDIVRCLNCGHCRAVHTLPLDDLYRHPYTAATYGESLGEAYQRIMALPPTGSDNASRVANLTTRLGLGRGRRLLDVGSGLGVFVALMKQSGWEAVTLDPDERAVAHARAVVKVTAILADWQMAPPAGQYDLVTFNKVLEHVTDPVSFLSRARSVLAPSGAVYVEVPDGELAARDGPGREEFFVEHWHVFSALSLAYLSVTAGFRLEWLERVCEPSGKYTLRALLHRP